MFLSKRISELENRLAEAHTDNTKWEERFNVLADENKNLIEEIETLKSEIEAYAAKEAELNAQIEQVKNDTENKINEIETQVEEKANELAIGIAAEQGIQPVIVQPEAETVVDISEQLTQIKDPVERAKFIKENIGKLLKKIT